MLFRLIIIGVGAWLMLTGWDEFRRAYSNPEPAKLSCANFIASADKPRWVSVDDCVMYLGKFEYTHSKGSEEIKSAGILLYATKKDAESDSAKTSVAIQVSNRAMLEEASKNIDLINTTNKKFEDVVARLGGKALPAAQRASLVEEGQSLQREGERLNALMFVTKPMVFKFSSERPHYNLLKDALTDDYTVYEISSADDKPSYGLAMVFAMIGLVLILGGVYSFIPKRKAVENQA